MKGPAEAVPDGTFGGRQTSTPAPRPPLRPWTSEEQAQHRQDLRDALDGWDWHSDYQEARRTRERNRTRRTPAPAKETA
ncbi:hypothetical protein ACFY40_11460 [Streptomyces sp. NPDC012950]|uniref:hypothetical protein n=1 Tax=Streptomyces sp. NPDC012950 TaxID=3364858 RepID=UPI00367F73CF